MRLSAVRRPVADVARALASIRHRRLDMHVLVCITVIGAGLIGEWSEGAAVAFLFALAHRLEAWSIERARREIAALVGRGPSLIAEGLQQSAPVERWIERFAAHLHAGRDRGCGHARPRPAARSMANGACGSTARWSSSCSRAPVPWSSPRRSRWSRR